MPRRYSDPDSDLFNFLRIGGGTPIQRIEWRVRHPYEGSIPEPYTEYVASINRRWQDEYLTREAAIRDEEFEEQVRREESDRATQAHWVSNPKSPTWMSVSFPTRDRVMPSSVDESLGARQEPNAQHIEGSADITAQSSEQPQDTGERQGVTQTLSSRSSAADGFGGLIIVHEESPPYSEHADESMREHQVFDIHELPIYGAQTGFERLPSYESVVRRGGNSR